MNTPITDAAMKYCSGGDRDFIPAEFARRLELDRAALMDALGECLRSMEAEPRCAYWFAKSNAQTALSAAHANFPTT